VNLTVIYSFLICTCKLVHIFVCAEKETSVIMMTVLGSTIQNVVTWQNGCPKFVTCEMVITPLVVALELCMAMYCEP
jgi:hypothetical protein